jgi:transposase
MSRKPRAETQAREQRALDLLEKGISNGTIAERFGVTPGAVTDMIHRARARREQEAPQT